MTAVTAALYVILTLVSASAGLAYAPVQLRISEALIVLAAFNPYAVLGLTLGCALANVGSSLGVIDMAVGSAASLAACSLIYLLGWLLKRKCRLLSTGTVLALTAAAALLSAGINGVAVGAEVVLTTLTDTPVTLFWTAFAGAAAGEAAVCVVLCPPILLAISKSRRLISFVSYDRNRS